MFPQYTTDTLGEPLNIIISSESDPDILTESGMQNYIKYARVATLIRTVPHR